MRSVQLARLQQFVSLLVAVKAGVVAVRGAVAVWDLQRCDGGVEGGNVDGVNGLCLQLQLMKMFVTLPLVWVQGVQVPLQWL